MWTQPILLSLCLWATVASAQVRPLPDADLHELPWSDGDDPIGVQRQDAELDRGPTPQHTPDVQAFGPKPPALSARRGDVLVAPASVRESQHRVHIEWRAGLALVTTELRFTATGPRPNEIKYRLPLPAEATLASLTVCTSAGCREGVVEPVGLLSAYDDAVQARGPGSALPVGHAATITDERGRAVSLRAAPVREGQDLVVRVAILVQAPVRGGAVRLLLPARGVDERAANAEVTLEGSSLAGVALGGAPVASAPAVFEPWRPIDLAARFSPSESIAIDWLRYRCGDQDCARLWLGAKAAALRDDDVALVLDASPSMRGPARGRVSAAVAGLLSVLPQDQPLDVVAFGATARVLMRGVKPQDVALTPLVDAIHAEDLGSGTRLSAAWGALQAWAETPAKGARRKHVVLVGDGTISANQAAVFEEVGRAHALVSVVNLSDHATADDLRPWVTATGGSALDVGREAAQATAGAPGALEEALGELFAERAGTLLTLLNIQSTGTERIKLGSISAGAQVSWNGSAGRRARILGATQRHADQRNHVSIKLLGTSPPETPPSERFGRALSVARDHPRDGLAAVDPTDLGRVGQDRPAPAPQCDPRGPAQRVSGVSSALDPVSLAEARPCRPPSPDLKVPATPANAGRGMPASPLLTMLRQRILPLARGCFRRDRAGRAEYELRAIFELELSNQEVNDARVVGDVPESLRACLIEAADHLDIPYFTGTVRARYPLRTQAEPLPEEIELSEGVAADLDRLLDGDGGALHTPPAF